MRVRLLPLLAATVAAGVSLLGGEARAVPYVIEYAFDAAPGGSDLESIGRDPASGDLFTYRARDGQQLVERYSATGALLGSFIVEGLHDDDADIDVLTEAVNFNNVIVPTGTLILGAGDEFGPSLRKVLAIDPTTGTVLSEFPFPMPELGGGGTAYNPHDDRIYLVSWISGMVAVVDPATGLELSRFAAPGDLWYFDIDVENATGNLFVASSVGERIYKTTSTGALLDTIDLTGLTYGGRTLDTISGIAYIDGTPKFWVATASGEIFLVAPGGPTSVPEPASAALSALGVAGLAARLRRRGE